MPIPVAPHPLLDARCLLATWPSPPRGLAPPGWLDALCGAEAPAGLPFGPPTPDEVKAVRDLFRATGFKPAGRSKPCSEYIRKVAEQGAFPRIDPAVDLTNAAALHGALPVSTLDVDRAAGPLRIDVAPAGTSIVFNASGQQLDVGCLPCVFDAEGPVADAVKDSQRTKVGEQTLRTLTVVWGTTALPARTDALARWLAERLVALGATLA
ncbi:MAG: hypothetical protein R3F59_01180 [Myxococcota bacterium]